MVTSSLANFEEVSKVKQGSSIRVQGNLIPSQAKGQAFELAVRHSDQGHKVEIIGHCDPGKYPLSKKQHSNEVIPLFIEY